VNASLHIVPLAKHSHLSLTLASWHSEAFGSWLGGWTTEEALFELLTHCDPDQLPCTWVALLGRQPVGSISLLHDDPPGPSHLGPWLASFYVVPTLRGRGIGSRLHDYCLQEAFRLGLRRLFLWTPGSASFYLPRGWLRAGALLAHGAPADLLERSLP
jgi:GNAT superfamily N-acetyltransferase